MKHPSLFVLIYAILILFFIQSAGTLVESIYILDLMNSSLDEKALGVLFFFTPLLALPFFNKNFRTVVWVLFTLLFFSHSLLPYLSTANRLPAAGIATGAALSLFFLLVTAMPQTARWAPGGLALAVGLSALLRTAGDGIELSLVPAGGWVGWVLGLTLGLLLAFAGLERQAHVGQTGGKVTAPILGIYLVLTLVYFSVSAPAVIVRWTESNYILVVSAVSLLSLVAAWVAVARPNWLARLSPHLLVIWNLLFTLSLTLTLLAHRVAFPPTPNSPAVVAGSPGWWQQIPLIAMLVLFPVLFVDLGVFLRRVVQAAPLPRQLVPGILWGSLALIVLVFINIFTNVWGYIDPISPPFRNTFWLAFFLMAGAITLLAWRAPAGAQASEDTPAASRPWAWALGFAALFLATLVFALPAPKVELAEGSQPSLRVMNFNTQQSNDDFGEKSVDAQLALIRQVSPDLLALQETDSTRISLNNNDYVRYFAEKLGYYSYYGPKTVTGTYGTAILSKYPLENTRSVFIYSDKDETGVAEAEIMVGDQRFTIYDVHPDSSDEAMLIFAMTLVESARGQDNVIALGDYNLRDYEAAYQVVDGALTNAWTSVYPSEISPEGVDMSGENRIDHIFISPHLKAINPTYILPPESATDHPVHWTDIALGAR